MALHPDASHCVNTHKISQSADTRDQTFYPQTVISKIDFKIDWLQISYLLKKKWNVCFWEVFDRDITGVIDISYWQRRSRSVPSQWGWHKGGRLRASGYPEIELCSLCFDIIRYGFLLFFSFRGRAYRLYLSDRTVWSIGFGCLILLTFIMPCKTRIP